MFATLPGAEMSYTLAARLQRALLYIHPVWVAFSIYQIHSKVDTVLGALLWGMAPLLSILLTWLLFSLPNSNSL